MKLFKYFKKYVLKKFMYWNQCSQISKISNFRKDLFSVINNS